MQRRDISITVVVGEKTDPMAFNPLKIRMKVYKQRARDYHAIHFQKEKNAKVESLNVISFLSKPWKSPKRRQIIETHTLDGTVEMQK